MKKIFIAAFLIRVIFSFIVWHPDVNNHIDWGIRFWDYGPENFYSANVWSFTWPNQPPGTVYIFAFIRKLFEFTFSVFWGINVNVPLFPSGIITYFESNLYPALLKLPAILCDLGIAYIIYKIFIDLNKKKIGIFAASIFLFNPIIWYNSSIWGQTDSIISFFSLLSFYFLLKRRLLIALPTLAISFYIKISLLVFLPVFLVFSLKQKYTVSEILKSLLISTVIIGILTLPFSKGEPFTWLFQIYKDKVLFQQLHVITANSFNIWAFLTGIHERPNTLFFGPFTYEFWGNALFVLSYIPAVYLTYKRQDAKSLFWSLSIISFSSYMLLTNMHERYLYPFFPVFTVTAVLQSGLLPIYWLLSGINVLNLYNYWWVPRVRFMVDALSAKDRLLPRLLGFVNFSIFVYLYNEFLRNLRISKL